MSCYFFSPSMKISALYVKRKPQQDCQFIPVKCTFSCRIVSLLIVFILVSEVRRSKHYVKAWGSSTKLQSNDHKLLQLHDLEINGGEGGLNMNCIHQCHISFLLPFSTLFLECLSFRAYNQIPLKMRRIKKEFQKLGQHPSHMTVYIIFHGQCFFSIIYIIFYYDIRFCCIWALMQAKRDGELIYYSYDFRPIIHLLNTTPPNWNKDVLCCSQIEMWYK